MPKCNICGRDLDDGATYATFPEGETVCAECDEECHNFSSSTLRACQTVRDQATLLDLAERVARLEERC